MYPVTHDDGDIIARPDFSFEATVDATPRAADVAIDFDEQVYTGLLPVVVRLILREFY